MDNLRNNIHKILSISQKINFSYLHLQYFKIKFFQLLNNMNCMNSSKSAQKKNDIDIPYSNIPEVIDIDEDIFS
jgi:hypothetical protein